MKPNEIITHRWQLATFIPPTGTAVELGVAAGVFSDQLLSNGPGFRLLSIDRWSDHHDHVERDQARQLLSRHGRRSGIMQATFEVALRVFADASLDLIYIDGYAHTGQEGGKTLDDWWPKLKRGGIFAGHDYHKTYQPTMDAVDAFMLKHKMPFSLTDGDELPSWWVRKD